VIQLYCLNPKCEHLLLRPASSGLTLDPPVADYHFICSHCGAEYDVRAAQIIPPTRVPSKSNATHNGRKVEPAESITPPSVDSSRLPPLDR
jgi:hypothetical protein